MRDLRRQMAQELAHLTRRLAERGPVALVVGDEGERAMVNEAHELEGLARDRMWARAHALREALQRLAEGRYGVCELCHKPIQARRLDVMPETPFCRDCAARLEQDADRRHRRRALDDEEDE